MDVNSLLFFLYKLCLPILLRFPPQGQNMYTGRCATVDKFAYIRTGLCRYKILSNCKVTLQVLETDRQTNCATPY
jgi:hypothetical protein